MDRARLFLGAGNLQKIINGSI
ncbi:hypothetical protein CCACVL1_18603 [Corchorus capsularis]|uniref:Uncharacterized protein n=1 Tax=Corchorus capsularis TaxID=210143 RepID=A0A1R3HKN4_COCAP|nr:hypothetical protein CCACVL1_18603 [Corchorus capsularis]